MKNTKEYKRIIYLLMVVGVLSLVLGCPNGSEPPAPVKGPPAAPGPLSLTATIEWTGYRSAVVGITANKDISDVGVILSDSDLLEKTTALTQEKVYYKRKLTADTKILVRLGLLNGFTLTNYTPDPPVISFDVDPATLRIPQPGETYYVYVFYPDHDYIKLEVTTVALPASAVTLVSPLQEQLTTIGDISYRAGELHIFPSVMQSGASVYSYEWKVDTRVFIQDFLSGEPISGEGGNILYVYNTSGDNFMESAVLRLMQGTETLASSEIADMSLDTGFIAYPLVLNN